jgi:pyridoxal phosphate enzyme (YggS family)
MRAGRDPHDVMLIAVSKEVEASTVREAYEAGLRTFGESRVQEASKKAGELALEGIDWHMIGHLQKNKAKDAVRLFDLIHSVESVELLRLLNKYAEQAGEVQKVLLQVNISGEESKFGVSGDEVGELLRGSLGMDNIRVEGLMTIPSFFNNPEKARPYYKRLRELAGEHMLSELSMGMTGDFEVAIEEGATMVRVGTAIFGERDYA